MVEVEFGKVPGWLCQRSVVGCSGGPVESEYTASKQQPYETTPWDGLIPIWVGTSDGRN